MTFLRWAGSKKQILSELSSCWFAATADAGPENFRYIEGFSGSASLFFHLRPKKAILVDVNVDLQHCLNRVKISPKGVAMALQKFEETEQEYYQIRSMPKHTLKPNERAAVFIYLNRNCFNGLYRTNRQGHFNVPYGGKRSGVLPSYGKLLEFSKMLESAELVVGDFYESLINRVSNNDFLYLDPPYAKINAKLDNQYGPDVFGINDVSRLGNLLTVADSKGAKFLVSYADCDEIREISNLWNSHRVTVRRTIAANAEKRGWANELLITNLKLKVD